ncbi:hypothetical protein FXO37_04477 [Capsicum annuum]|nr:hypothetical protein FXO37_04477 [Capsicum annuum]
MVVSSCLLSSSLSLPIAAKCGHCRHANSNDSMRSIFMEQQVSIVLYSDDIPKYKNLFLLFHTYVVSCAKVRDARGYSIRAGRYEWVADKYTIVEPITDNDGLEAPLAALEKLSPLPFSAIEQQHPGSEFDLLAVVVNCSALQYTADQSKHFREAIVMDQRQGEADRTNVVVLYFRSSSSSTSSLNLAPIEDQVQSISTIPQSLSMVQTVPVEGRISLPDHSQSFYLLACSNCNHYLLPIKTNSDLCRVHITNDTTKPVCMMCHFNIDFTDSNVTITATVSEALAERILSLTVDQIYDKVVVQKQPLSIAGINRQLDRELFKLQLQKSAFRFPDQKPDALAIASFTKTEQTGEFQFITATYTFVLLILAGGLLIYSQRTYMKKLWNLINLQYSAAKPGKVVGPGFAYDFGNKEKHDSRPQSRNVVDPPPQIMPSAYC